MRTMGPNPWDDETTLETMKAMHADGASAGQIARALGRGISRNAVIGKIHRLGLQRPASPAVARAWARTNHAPRPRLPRPEIETLPPPPPDPSDAEAPGCEIVALNNATCRWPIGDPHDRDFHFCGRKPLDGSPYCETHKRRSRQPNQPRVTIWV